MGKLPTKSGEEVQNKVYTKTAKPISYNKKNNKKQKNKYKILMEVNKMKKLISIILSLALVACMFGMTVMAAETGTVNGNKGQIGSYVGEGGPISGGKETFNETEFSKDVNLTIKDKNSRYAVDIVFGGTSSYTNTVEGITWNENTLKYEVADNFSMNDLTYKFTVTNYSDSPIYSKVAASNIPQYNAADLVTVTFDNDAKLDCTGNAHGTLIANVATKTVNATISPATGTWKDVINTLLVKEANYNGEVDYVLAKFTVTVSKTALA